MNSRSTTVEPGDLMDAVRKLRRLLSAFDDARFVINGSFASLDAELEAAAVDLRQHTQEGATSVFQFLEKLEQHPEVVKQRRHLQSRGDSHLF